MINILVTGEKGYIGQELVKRLLEEHDIKIELISLKNKKWKERSFSGYDVVVHLAGIAHVSKDEKMKDQYYKVNADLTFELAQKSKKDGVKKFIFMSSIIVFGNKDFNSVIDKNTIPNPNDFYGDSKLKAENAIKELKDDSFNIYIVRSPLVYGGNVKGNYKILEKYSKYMFFFPLIDNKRSMIHIKNLCEFLTILIKNNKINQLYFYPQDEKYTTIKDLILFFNPNVLYIKVPSKIIVKLFSKNMYFKKVFGTLIYKKELSNFEWDYNVMTKRKIEMDE